MVTSGRFLRMGLLAITREVNNTGKTTVCLLVNGEAQRDYKVTTSEGDHLAATMFGRALEVGFGSVINFMPTRTDT